MRAKSIIWLPFVGLLASACNYKQSASSGAVTAASVTIVTGAASQHSMAFSPNPFTVAAGTPVVWMNGDSTNHTITSDAATFDSGTLGASQQFSFTFTTPGTYTYHCSVHPSMTGTIVVQ